MRRKPTFEELAGAALKKPVLAKPPPTYVPHNDNEVAVAQLRAMSDDLKTHSAGVNLQGHRPS